jgi:hypothetical protein
MEKFEFSPLFDRNFLGATSQFLQRVGRTNVSSIGERGAVLVELK